MSLARDGFVFSFTLADRKTEPQARDLFDCKVICYFNRMTQPSIIVLQ